MIKYIFCDMDGTLLNTDKLVSEENKKAIEMAREQGVTFSIATGRIYPAARIYAKELGILDSPMVCCNGGVVVDPRTGGIIVDHPMDPVVIDKLIDIARKHKIYYHVYDLDTIYAEQYEKIIKYYGEFSKGVPLDERINTVVVPDLKTVVAEGKRIYKFGIYIEESHEMSDHILAELASVEGVDTFRSMENMYDYLNVGVNKGSMIQHLCDHLNIDKAEVACIGDNENDIEMLKIAGFGIAMGNADDHIKAHADFIVPSNDEHGVMHAIATILQFKG